ncbi:hypothetical protein [Variovorax sp. PvP013]|uniref:hypothetical protein n=1 Tax=Variovorax sp. PvP013 TaxID=3156435 RepID=UPI003D1A4AB2
MPESTALLSRRHTDFASRFLMETYLLASASLQPAKGGENEFVKAGRSVACELIECLRLGNWEDLDSLQAALAIVEPAGAEVMRGFLRELTDAIREGSQ